jgi:hypothetical protein
MAASFSITDRYNVEKAFSQVVFPDDAPLMEVDLNEMQKILKSRTLSLVQSVMTNGFVNKPTMTYAGSNLTVPPDTFVINGQLITLTENMTISAASGETVYLAVWEQTVAYNTTLKKGGNQSGGSTISNTDIFDARVNEETSRRVQVQVQLVKSTADTSKAYLNVASFPSGVMTDLRDFSILNVTGKIDSTVTAKFDATTGHKHTGGAGDAPKIGTSGIEDAAVTTAKVQDLGISTAKLANQAVTTAKIASKAVEAAQLGDGSATDTVIGNRTVAQGTVTAFSSTGSLNQLLSWYAKQFHTMNGKTNWYDTPDLTLAAAALKFSGTTGHTHSGSAGDAPQIQSAGIANSAITGVKIAAGAVGATHITDGVITGVKLANKTIGASQIGDNVITATQLANGAGTDTVLGNRTVDQAIAATVSNTGTLTQVLSWIVKEIKAVKGTAGWGDSVANALNNALSKSGDTMTGGFLTLYQAPTSNLHAATKLYVDQQAAASKTYG